MSPRLIHEITRRLRALAMILCLYQIAALLFAHSWPFSLMIHPQPLIASLSLISLLGLRWLHKRSSSQYKRNNQIAIALNSISFGISCVLLVTLFIPKYPPIYPHPLKVLTANIGFTNKQHAEFEKLIDKHQPDIIALIEYPPAWEALAKNLQAKYPWQQTQPENTPWGMALFSRLPLQELNTQLSPQGYPTITAKLHKPGFRHIQIQVLHAPPPVSSKLFLQRSNYLNWISQLSNQQGSKLLIGDLNLTPWSPIFKDWKNANQLSDSRSMSGIANTWPQSLGYLGIPLDYILTGGDLWTTDLKRLHIPDSDHAGLLATVAYTSEAIIIP